MWFFNEIERDSRLNNIKSTEELHKLASELATPEYPVWNITRMEENNINGRPIIYFKKNLDNGSFKKVNEYLDIGYLDKNVIRNENNRLLMFFLDAPIFNIRGFVDEFGEENIFVGSDNSVELTNLNNYFIFKENESSSFEAVDTVNNNSSYPDLKIMQASWSVEDKELFVKFKNNSQENIKETNYHCIFELSENIENVEHSSHGRFLKVKYNGQFYWLSKVINIDYVCNLYYKYYSGLERVSGSSEFKFIYLYQKIYYRVNQLILR